MRYSRTQYALIKHKDLTHYTLSNSYIFKLQLCYSSRIWMHLKPRFYQCGVIITHTIVCVIHHVDQWTISSYALKYQSFIPNPIPTKFCSHVLNYSTCKCANWVLQAFLKPSLVPKCDIYYLKNKCCYTYSNSIVVALSHTYVIYYTWTILKLIYALIKHKSFINPILPKPNSLSTHIDLSQLSSPIHISQIMILYHIFLVITSQ
jgi:hypothetical protein